MDDLTTMTKADFDRLSDGQLRELRKKQWEDIARRMEKVEKMLDRLVADSKPSIKKED